MGRGSMGRVVGCLPSTDEAFGAMPGIPWGLGGQEKSHWSGCSPELTSPKTISPTNQTVLLLTEPPTPTPAPHSGAARSSRRLIHRHTEPGLLAELELSIVLNG